MCPPQRTNTPLTRKPPEVKREVRQWWVAGHTEGLPPPLPFGQAHLEVPRGADCAAVARASRRSRSPGGSSLPPCRNGQFGPDYGRFPDRKGLPPSHASNAQDLPETAPLAADFRQTVRSSRLRALAGLALRPTPPLERDEERKTAWSALLDCGGWELCWCVSRRPFLFLRMRRRPIRYLASEKGMTFSAGGVLPAGAPPPVVEKGRPAWAAGGCAPLLASAAGPIQRRPVWTRCPRNAGSRAVDSAAPAAGGRERPEDSAPQALTGCRFRA